MFHIRKAHGEIVDFSETKLRKSIQRAGIPDTLQEQVVDHVKSKLYENIPTLEIYHHITEFLHKEAPYQQAKYSLKHGLMQLGPTGYPFEDFVADVLKAQGYQTQVRTVLMGRCISHEIDVIAQKGNEKIMVEAKFHNNPGTRTESHVSMYTKARFDDLKVKHGFTKAWLVTNTKATSDAIGYAECVEMDITAWSYPNGKSLRELIEGAKLQPITVFTSLSQRNKEQLLADHVVLTKEICANPALLDTLGLPEEKKKQVLEEAKVVCNL